MRDFFSLSEEKKAGAVKKFWSNVNKNSPDGCWKWTGNLNRDGYGRICHYNFENLAHRFSWTIKYNSPIPKGLLCIHSCDRRNCVRPEHIALGTNQQNLKDRVLKDRSKLKPLGERLKIAEAVFRGSTTSQVAEAYKIGAATVIRYLKTDEIVARYGKIDLSYRSRLRTGTFPSLI